MKRIATAAVAATLSLSALSAPAFAADADTTPAKENQGSSAQAEGDQAGEKVGSSEVYKQCKEGKKAEAEKIRSGPFHVTIWPSPFFSLVLYI